MNYTNPSPRRARVIPAFDDESAIRFLDRQRSRPFDRLPEIAPNIGAFMASLRECPESIVLPANLRQYGLPADPFADRELIEAVIRRLFIDAELRRQLRDAISDRRFPSRNRRAGR